MADQKKFTKKYNVTRRVSWGECDPAGIIYTPRALDFGAETLEAWIRDVLGITWFEMNTKMGLGMPTVRVEIDYVGVLAVDAEVTCTLTVERLGNSSLTSRVTAHDGAGQDFFHVTLVSCLVEKPAFKALPWPDDLRAKIEPFLVV